MAGTQSATDRTAANQADATRSRYGFWIVVLGLVLVGGAFAFAVWRFTEPVAIAAALGPLFGVVGTIGGAFFGISVGSQGKEKAEAERSDAQKERDTSKAQVAALAAELPESRRNEVLASFR